MRNNIVGCALLVAGWCLCYLRSRYVTVIKFKLRACMLRAAIVEERLLMNTLRAAGRSPAPSGYVCFDANGGTTRSARASRSGRCVFAIEWLTSLLLCGSAYVQLLVSLSVLAHLLLQDTVESCQ